MKDINDIFFFIQARIGSQRVKNKMLKPFCNSNLLEIAIQKVLESKIIPRNNFYLSVGDDELIDIANAYNINVFNRSYDSLHTESSMKVLFEWYNKVNYTYAVMINPCLPFLSIETINDFVKTYIEQEEDGLFGVVKKKNFFYNMDGVLVNKWPENSKFTNTKMVEGLYEATHCLYAGRCSKIEDDIWMGTFKKPGDPVLYEMEDEESFDIDYEWQFKMGEQYYKYKESNSCGED